MEAEKLECTATKVRQTLVETDEKSLRKQRSLAPLIEIAIVPALDDACKAIRSRPEMRRMFRDNWHRERARAAQKAHWIRIAQSSFCAQDVGSARRIGAAHARTGLDPRWYIRRYSLIHESIVESALTASSQRAFSMRGSIAAKVKDIRVIQAALFELEISISTYLKTDADRKRSDALQTHALDLLADTLEEVAADRLAIIIDPSLSEKSARLVSSFNRATGRLRQIIQQIRESSAKIQTATTEIERATSSFAQRTEQQPVSLEEPAASLDDLAQTVSATAERAKRTDTTAVAARLEVAPAGDAGRVYAVEASEIRRLAQRSAEAARTIKALIISSEHVQSGVVVVDNTSQVLIRAVHAFSEINTLVSSMVSTATGLATSIAEESKTVRHLDQMTQMNTVMVEEPSAACASLASETGAMSGPVNIFRTEGR